MVKQEKAVAKGSFNRKKKDVETEKVEDFDEFDLDNPLSETTDNEAKKVKAAAQTKKPSIKKKKSEKLKESTGAADEFVKEIKGDAPV